MNVCPNCGEKLDNNDFKFCPECGYKFESDLNDSNMEKSGGFVSSFINDVREELPDYIDKIKSNEIIDDAVTHAKIIWHGPKTDKEKEYKKRKNQEKERKKYERKETAKEYKKKIWVREEEIVDDIKQGFKTCPICGKQIPHNAIRCKYCKTMLKTYSTNKSLETLNKSNGVEKSKTSTIQKTCEVDYSNLDLSDLQESLIKSLPLINNPSEYEENIIKKYAEYNSEERKELLKDCWTITKLAEKHNLKRHEVEKAILTDDFLNKNLIGVFKINPNNIRSLKILYCKPLIENVVVDEGDYGEVKENLKKQVEKEGMVFDDDVGEEKNIIGNKTIEQAQMEEKQMGLDSSAEKKVVEEKRVAQQEVSVDKTVEEKAESFQEKTANISNKPNKKIYKKTKTQGKKRGFFSKKSPELKRLEKDLTYYLGGIGDSEYYLQRQNDINGFRAPGGNIKTILIDEFENNNLSMDDLTTRIDELIVLDNLSLIKYMLREGYDTSVIKTQDDLYDFLKEKHDEITANESNLKIMLHRLGIWGFGDNDIIKSILMKEFEEGNLSIDNVETRILELKDLDINAMKMWLLHKNHDTSVIKTQDDLYEFLKEHYGIKVAKESNKKKYRKEELFKKYGVDYSEVYTFKCTIEERRSSTFSNTDKRNIDQAHCALYDDHIVIIKESVWLKSDMGMRKVYFNNVTSIDYDTAGKLGMSSSLFVHMHSGEHVQLKFISKKDVDEIHKRFESYNNEKNVNNVAVTQETSSADELLKYADLLKQGLITKEEFEAKKKELL